MTAPIKAATALFNLSVIIRMITPKKHAKIIIILRTILPPSSNMIYETTRIYS